MSDVDTLDDAPEPTDVEESVEAEAQDADDAEDAEDVAEDVYDDDDEGDGGPPAFERVNYEGKDYEVPTALKDALLRQSDYTRKTQEVSDQRKALQEQAAEMAEIIQLRDQQFDQAAAIKALDQQIHAYDQVDWQALMAEDPEAFQRLDFEKRTLKDQRDAVNQQLHQKSAEASQVQHAQLAKAAEKTRAELTKEFDDWSPELEESMAQYAISQGVPERQLRTTVDKGVLKILYDAHKYDEIRRKRAAATSKKSKPTTAEPVTRVRGRKHGGRKDPDKMSVAEWNKWRESQIAKRQSA
tara:strand:+ start:514 stop:1407 length:894 start_codon:yes stop_codon:yes gene_type:complete